MNNGDTMNVHFDNPVGTGAGLVVGVTLGALAVGLVVGGFALLAGGGIAGAKEAFKNATGRGSSSASTTSSEPDPDDN
jgi:hypothetical protein